MAKRKRKPLSINKKRDIAVLDRDLKWKRADIAKELRPSLSTFSTAVEKRKADTLIFDCKTKEARGKARELGRGSVFVVQATT